MSQYVRGNTPNNTTRISSYPILWLEEYDLRSVALLEARAKVNDIKISIQGEELKRYTLRRYLLVYLPWGLCR